MRLNTSDRDAFVTAVIDDVPTIDYDQQARDTVEAHFRDIAPDCIREAVESYPDWVDSSYVYMPGTLDNYYSKLVPQAVCRSIDKEYPALWKKLEKISRANHEQEQVISALRSKVRAAISMCTTLKRAKEVLPEFEKYLPADRSPAGTAGVPMIANVVTDLMKAGWPKEKGDAHPNHP